MSIFLDNVAPISIETVDKSVYEDRSIAGNGRSKCLYGVSDPLQVLLTAILNYEKL